MGHCNQHAAIDGHRSADEDSPRESPAIDLELLQVLRLGKNAGCRPVEIHSLTVGVGSFRRREGIETALGGLFDVHGDC